MATKSPTRNSSIILNLIWNSILSVSSIMFPLITFPYITRVLGVEVNGALNFAQSTVNYFSLFAMLGISTYGVRACSRVKDDPDQLSRVVHELFIVTSISAVIVLAVLYIFVMFVPYFYENSLLIFIFSLNIIFNVLGINWMFQGIERYRYITSRSVFFKIISIVMMFLFVKSPADGAIYAAISVFATAGGNILNIFHARRYIRFKPVGGYHPFRHLNSLVVLFATALAINVYSNLDSVMLGFMQGDYATGIYAVSVKVKIILVMLISSFSVVFLSRLSYMNANSGADAMDGTLRISMQLSLFVSIPVVAFFVLEAADAIDLLASSSYMDAYLPMIIMLPALIFSSVSQVLGGQYSVAVGKEKNLMFAVIIGAVVDLVLNFLLIPVLSFTGAAIGTLVAEMVQCCIQAFLARDVVKRIFSGKNLLQVSACTALASLTCWGVVATLPDAGSFVRLALGALAFAAVYFPAMYAIGFGICRDMGRYLIAKIRRQNSK